MNDQPDALKNIQKMLHEQCVKDVMNSPVKTIDVDADFSDVGELFFKERIRHLPVVDADNKLVGVITQRDLYKAVSPRKTIGEANIYGKDLMVDDKSYYNKESLNQFIINNVMHKNPTCLKPEDSIGKAIDIMVNKKIGCVPIVDDDHKVCGIITRFDMLKLVSQLSLDYQSEHPE